jgi:hypothetical protein
MNGATRFSCDLLLRDLWRAPIDATVPPCSAVWTADDAALLSPLNAASNRRLRHDAR